MLPEVERGLIKTGALQLVFKHLPLEALHPDAPLAAQVAECARQQNHFRPVHDAFFAAPRGNGNADFLAIARRQKLESKRLDACLGGDVAARVEADIAEARGFGVAGTPAFLFGRLLPDGRVQAVRWQRGMIPARAFTAIADEVVRGGQ